MNKRNLRLLSLSIAVIFTMPTLVNLAVMISIGSNTHMPPFMNPTSPTSSFTLLPSPFLAWHSADPLSSFLIKIYDDSPFISSIAWTLFLVALFYKGKTKSLWHKSGFDYDIFKTFVKMRGGPIRIKILQILNLPKNKHQIANELGFDWRSVDNHIVILLKHGLIKEMVLVGTATYFIVTKRGGDVLTLLNNSH